MSTSTLSDHAFDLRSGLREAARTSLREFETTISDIGYGWLDGYMESVMQGPFKNSIHELMKTPSRTQTVKKTRAITTAAKDRTEKIKRMNALSPLAKASPARQPFSPLQPRSLNVPSPSALLNTPTKGGKGGLKLLGGVEKEKDKVKKGKGKVKKGKAKKVVQEELPEELNEIANPTPSLPAPNPHPPTAHHSLSARQQALTPVTTVRSTPSPHSQASDMLKKAHDIQVDDDIANTIEEVIVEVRTEATLPTVQSVPVPAKDQAKKVIDLSMIVEAEEEASSRSMSNIGNLSVKPDSQSARPAPAKSSIVEHLEVEGEIVVAQQAVPISSTQLPPSPDATAVQSNDSPKELPVTTSIIPPTLLAHPIPAASVVEAPTPATHVPTRQVRSSWLSKALGTGTVPVRLSDDIRKSMAAPSGSKPLDHLELIRKSLAPAGSLESSVGSSKKRASEVVLDEEEGRRLKAVKVDVGVKNKGNEEVLVRQATQVSFAQGPVAIPPPPQDATLAPLALEPQVSAIPPQASITPTIDTDTRQATQEPSNPTRHRSDIHKVTKALDELREKAAAKEAQRARAQSIHAQTQTPHNGTTPGGGFFRGLGRSLGLTGGGRNAEEEAARLERELKAEEEEAEREAREELERLMADEEGEAERGEMDVEEEEEVVVVAIQDTKEVEPQFSGKEMVWATIVPTQAEGIVAESRKEVANPVFQLAPIVIPTVKPQSAHVRPATPPRQPHHRVQQSTTPANTPPRLVVHREDAPAIGGRGEKHTHEQGARVPKVVPAVHVDKKEPEQEKAEVMEVDELDSEAATDEGEQDEEEEEEEVEEIEGNNTISRPLGKSMLSMSTASQLPESDMIGRASTIAAKTLGFKPSTGQVKSIQMASALAKKEQAANERKAFLRDQAEQRKKENARKRVEEEQLKAEEDKKARLAELEEKKKLRAENERKRKEREEKIAIAAKEAAKARTEEEANKKRKFAPMLNKSGSINPVKRIAQPTPSAPAPSGPQSLLKAKEQLRPVKPAHSLAPAGIPPYTAPKLGQNSFRTVETSTTQTTSSTITLVTQPTQPRPLGPPSRPSQMAGASSSSHYPPAQAVGGSKPLLVLQQNRVALQHQLEERAIEVQSEDIDLPDIASEYSDSGDEKSSPDFKRPQWAESPALRKALADQASRNPDELFGAIKPVSMEELFKVKQGKFRARTSSANWSKGDGLTRAEEVEYAKRMGFGRM